MSKSIDILNELVGRVDFQYETRTVLVTPQIAATWLERNKNNRSMRTRHVRSLERDMSSGNWVDSADPIKFAVDGRLIDGQHRLQALVNCGATLPFLVVGGLERSVFTVTDTGLKRSGADAIHIATGEGNKICAVAATVCGFVFRLREGKRSGWDLVKPLSNEEVRATFEDNPCILSAVKTVRALGSTPVSQTAAALVLFLATEAGADPGELTAFFARAVEGTGLTKSDPLWFMRDMIQRAKAAKRSYSSIAQARAFIRIWNAEYLMSRNKWKARRPAETPYWASNRARKVMTEDTPVPQVLPTGESK